MDSEVREPEAHGGNLAAAERAFGRPADGWLDLSTGINPIPYPHVALSAATLARLPGEAEHDRLLAAARAYYGVPQGMAVVAAAGTQQVIQLLPSLIAGERVAIAGPTYGEHERVWTRAGRAVAPHAKWFVLERADISVVVNPNNPDGRVVERARLGELADDLAKRRGVLIVDEAFCDLVPEASAVPLRPRANLVVLRSFGKFFGLGGLRLGFCIAPPEIAERLSDALGPWAVSGPALEIGARALADRAWISDTRGRLAAARARLDAVLAGAGLTVSGGTDLFRLVEDAGAAALHRRLGQAGILVRAFADRPTCLRIGLPATDADFARLAQALSSR